MFDVLMYLFETYIHSDMDTVEWFVDHYQLTEELIHVGFHYDDIDKALHWMERLAALQNNDTVPYLISANPHSIRLYTVLEMARLDSKCRGFLLFLERIQILNPETREMVIDRVMELESSALSLEDLKWVVLMVLFNVPGHESAYHQMEALLFEFDNAQFH